MRIGSTYIQLISDAHIASVARVKAKRLVLLPNSNTICNVKVKHHSPFDSNSLGEIFPTETKFLDENPELIVIGSICPGKFKRNIPVTVVNSSQKNIYS